jgi:hypothetical protein
MPAQCSQIQLHPIVGSDSKPDPEKSQALAALIVEVDEKL